MPGKPARAWLLPGDDFARRSIPVTRQEARTWYRVHWADVSATRFAMNPGHRFSHADCPYPMLYVGPSIQTCLWEVFGDDVFQNERVIARTRWAGSCLSEISLPELKVCAISTARTRSVMGVDKGNLLAADLTIPQAWGLSIQRHPADFEGIKYTSRFVDQPCLALIGRPGLPARLRTRQLGTLSDLDEAVEWMHAHKAALA